MAVNEGNLQPRMSKMDAVDARANAWLWLCLEREGAPLPLDSFGKSKVDLAPFALPNRIETLLGYEMARGLLPQELLAWIAEEKRQNDWLLSYIRRHFKLALIVVPPRLLGRNLVIALLDIWDVDLVSKARAVSQMERDWNQHTQGDRIFEWFKDDETARCKLAWDWLVDRKQYSVMGKATISNHSELLMFFDGLHISEHETKLNVDSIKKRWSQQQYRKKMKGKSQCNFWLSDQAINKLDKFALKYNVGRAQILEALIVLETDRGVYLPGHVQAVAWS
jgi:hypothetical protein